MFLRLRKKPFTIEGPPQSKGLYLILPQKYCHKIKYETFGTLGRRCATPSPRCILRGARKQKGRKGRKSDVELETRTAIQTHTTAAECYRITIYNHIRTEIISAMERHGTGPDHSQRKRGRGKRTD
ncbi:hypothetical protein JTE90_015698 [Oedothorax gibbosus]|uniref:Uncharacterized protein n=1 Tax=Oedothorax gibbosus TaxID=931172 RepID=A0AAV6THG0_9ARAC|nr:hypothetical protein JTE90_015698 [Oedothorax gibbosus]